MAHYLAEHASERVHADGIELSSSPDEFGSGFLPSQRISAFVKYKFNMADKQNSVFVRMTALRFFDKVRVDSNATTFAEGPTNPDVRPGLRHGPHRQHPQDQASGRGQGEKLVQMLQDYSEALRVLASSIANHQFMGLLRGAFTSGLLSIARTPQTLPHIAAALNVGEERAAALCLALEAYGVLIRDSGRYQVDERWAILSAPEAPIAFQTMLDAADAVAHALEHAALGSYDYRTLPGDARLALARGGTFDPTSPYAPTILETLLRDSAPEVHAMLAAGGRYLELGCGIGGTLLSLLRAYPLMTAVGVELAGDVLNEARRRATALGVSRRVVFYQGDARDFSEFAAFDVASWSQSFFPTPTRALTLQVARYALKPGGFLLVPLMKDWPAQSEGMPSDEVRQSLLQRMLYSGWDIPVLDVPDIQQEIEAAGFDATGLVTTPLQHIIVARCPAIE